MPTPEEYIAGLDEPRRISVYVQAVSDGAYLAEGYRDRLATASIGKSCVRFKRPADIDLDTLSALISHAAAIGPPA